jgi:hypothetical protein
VGRTFGTCILIAGLLVHISSEASAQVPAGIDILVEELESIGEATAGNTREISTLKERMDRLIESLDHEAAARAEAEARLDETRTELDTARKRLESLEGDRFWKGRRLPRIVPSLEARFRPMGENNRTDLDSSQADGDVFVQQRVRMGLGLDIGNGVLGKVVLQDSREWGAAGSTTSDEHALDIYEGYVLIDDIGGSGLEIQAGRMAMAYGAGRQVSKRDFNNVGQSFDGIRIAWERSGILKADVFTTLVRTGISPVFQSGRGFDRYSSFSGLYLSTSGIPWIEADLYGLYLDNAFNEAVEKFGTVGARILSRPVPGLVLEGEAAVQVGTVEVRARDASRLEASHLATMYFFQVFYETQVTTNPGIGLQFYSSSGDANPYDARNVSYRPTFRSTTGVYGYLDLFDYQGVWEIGPRFRLRPHETVVLHLDYHLFLLSSDGGMVKAFGTGSGWAGDRGTANDVYRHVLFPNGGSRFVGQELDILLTWAATPWLALEMQYSFFKPGSRVRGAQTVSIQEVDDPATGGTTPVWRRDVMLGMDWAHRGYVTMTATF